MSKVAQFSLGGYGPCLTQGQHHYLLSSVRSLPNLFMHKQIVKVTETYV